MNLLVAVWFCLLPTLSPGYSASLDTSLVRVLENALISDTHNLAALQSVFYPAKTASPNFVSIIIDNCTFVVKKIDQLYDVDHPGFSNCSSLCQLNTSEYCSTVIKPVHLSDQENSKLLHFIYSENIVELLETVDYVSFELFDLMTRSQLRYLQPFDSDYEHFVPISLSIDELQMMPSQDDLWHSVELLLSWSRYYARSYGKTSVPKEESDRMTVVSWPEDGVSRKVLNWISIVGLYLILNIVIAIVSIYSAPTVLRVLLDAPQKSDSLTRREVCSSFWALVIVCGVLNIACFVVYFSFVDIFYILVFSSGPMIVIFLIEVISVWIIVKDVRMIDSFCCFSNRYLLRAVHTLAVCHILWFLHRVGCGLMVSLFFLALAPAQTLAAIAVIFAILVITIRYVAFNIHHFKRTQCFTRQSCKLAFKYIMAFILYCSFIGGLIFVLVIYVQLIGNYSVLGDVVLSFVALAIIFAIALLIKRRSEKYFKHSCAES